MRRVTAILVPARYDVDGKGAKTAIAAFRLGLGPCGKVVESLRIEHRRQFVVIGQHHSDGTTVKFSYAHAQLTGRIEVHRD